MARIYTDGSCRRGIGGWAWWNEDTNAEMVGSAQNTTNQRMELYAVHDAIHEHMDDEEITIVSDSAYVVNCFGQDWWVRWQRNKWLNVKNEPVSNKDIWEPLIELVQEHGNVKFEWVKGHSGVHGNERVDLLAREAMLAVSEGLDAIERKKAAIKDAQQSKQAPKTIAALERNSRKVLAETGMSGTFEPVKFGTTLKISKADLEGSNVNLRAILTEELRRGTT